jgi:F-box and WD-40 domain protein 7
LNPVVSRLGVVEFLRCRMHAVQGQYARRRILPREVAGEKQTALEESIELRYQICYLFKALSKQEKYKRLQGVCDDPSWLMQQFAGMLDVPKYALMKTCPAVEGEDFSFYPVICEEKVYSKVINCCDIRVTNCNDDSLITTLTGHTDELRCLVLDGGQLYSCSDDSTIKIWNCSTDTLIKTLTGHTDCVVCLIINDGKLYSGSFDNSVKVWNCSNHTLITTLGVPDDEDGEGGYVGHTHYVKCLTFHGGKLYSGSEDNTIKVWDCSTNKLIKTLTRHTRPVICFTIHDGKLYSGGRDGIIKVWDCSDDTLIKTLEGHTGWVNCLTVHGGKLYSGSWDKTIKIWDCGDYSLITTLRGHTQVVEEFTFQNDKLYAKYFHGEIKIWKL